MANTVRETTELQVEFTFADADGNSTKRTVKLPNPKAVTELNTLAPAFKAACINGEFKDFVQPSNWQDDADTADIPFDEYTTKNVIVSHFTSTEVFIDDTLALTATPSYISAYSVTEDNEGYELLPTVTLVYDGDAKPTTVTGDVFRSSTGNDTTVNGKTITFSLPQTDTKIIFPTTDANNAPLHTMHVTVQDVGTVDITFANFFEGEMGGVQIGSLFTTVNA